MYYYYQNQNSSIFRSEEQAETFQGDYFLQKARLCVIKHAANYPIAQIVLLNEVQRVKLPIQNTVQWESLN